MLNLPWRTVSSTVLRQLQSTIVPVSAQAPRSHPGPPHAPTPLSASLNEGLHSFHHASRPTSSMQLLSPLYRPIIVPNATMAAQDVYIPCQHVADRVCMAILSIPVA